MTQEVKDRLESSLPKLLSGRFILTIVSAAVFFEITDCLCQLLIMKSDEITISDVLNIGNMILIIISNIFTFYFTRERYNNNTNQTETVTIEKEKSN